MNFSINLNEKKGLNSTDNLKSFQKETQSITN